MLDKGFGIKNSGAVGFPWMNDHRFWYHLVWLGPHGQVEMRPPSTLGRYRWPTQEVLNMIQGACSDSWSQGILADTREKVRGRSPLKTSAQVWRVMLSVSRQGNEVWIKIGVYQDRAMRVGELENSSPPTKQGLTCSAGFIGSSGLRSPLVSSQASGHSSSSVLQEQSPSWAASWATGSRRA